MRVSSWKFWVLLGMGAVILSGLFHAPAFSRSQARWAHLTFTSHRHSLKFFDHRTGKLYVYGEADGKLDRIWILTRLGENLRRGN